MKKRACCVCTKNFAGNAQFFEIALQRHAERRGGIAAKRGENMQKLWVEFPRGLRTCWTIVVQRAEP